MINFVTEQNKWVLGRWCDEWSALIPSSTVSHTADKGKVNVYVNYNLWSGIRTQLDICYYTHREHNDLALQQKFDETAKECDFCLAQCDITAGLLPKDKTMIVKPGVGKRFVKDKITLGVPFRDYPSNRKRLDLARRVASEVEHIQLQFANGNVDYDEMPYWYESVDYVLITSDNEGGPMGVLEAIARGKPLIVPRDVGWCNDYPALRFGDYDELRELVQGLVYNRKQWVQSAKQIVDLVDELI